VFGKVCKPELGRERNFKSHEREREREPEREGARFLVTPNHVGAKKYLETI
jgi:hypothetical protein